MRDPSLEQSPELRIGVDVGGTFTDLVAFDGQSLRIVKVPSTPPEFHRGVIQAIRRLSPSPPEGEGRGEGESALTTTGSTTSIGSVALTPHPNPLPQGEREVEAHLIHGSTVATNALLQRAGEPIAFVTTEGFRDMLLIGRQNRPALYALHVQRPAPIALPENCFTVRERIDPQGNVVQPLEDAEVDRVIEQIRHRSLRHVAVCLLFSFVNPSHERRIAQRMQAGGLSVSLSSEILPEFREYERASTTGINASLRPTVQRYLELLREGMAEISGLGFQGPEKDRVSPSLNPEPRTLNPSLRIMHSGGGTLSIDEAAATAVRLVLSGPAGGAMGAAFVAGLHGFDRVISYDMGGTSTDVATIIDGQPQWTTLSAIDGLPIGLPMFDIHTVGAGGGSIAYLDTGGALRVGPRSAGAVPGPACYDRGGTEPTVTDANLLLGRIRPDQFLGGAVSVRPELAEAVVAKLASAMGKGVIEAALGIVRVAESNMAQAVRAVTSRRGQDPRQFTLVSFGGAGGLHACAIAEQLEIPRVLVPPMAGVLSALGMIVAPPIADASKTVVHLGGALDDDRLAAEFGDLSRQTMEQISYGETAATEVYADVRFRGQSHEVKVRIDRPSRDVIFQRFIEAYASLYGQAPRHRSIEIVTLRVRRIGRTPAVRLPELARSPAAPVKLTITDAAGVQREALARARTQIPVDRPATGPFLLIDAEATTFVPAGWHATGTSDGSVIVRHAGE